MESRVCQPRFEQKAVFCPFKDDEDSGIGIGGLRQVVMCIHEISLSLPLAGSAPSYEILKLNVSYA